MVQRYANPRDNVLCCALQAEVTAMSIAARQGNVAEIAKRAAAVMDYAGAQIITQVDHNARSDVPISVLNAAQYLAAIPALMTMFGDQEAYSACGTTDAAVREADKIHCVFTGDAVRTNTRFKATYKQRQHFPATASSYLRHIA
ncbi:hypothetical protein JG687_00014434 [Phytophthora cactorum]|uniref:Uncharacterized protein n=2 Tax=Phytophthora cactorum TaxID=29920 RepID=A0A329SUU0_9STRA|nr:hypothetical protein PC119_g335 [Phytophthora cactorum]KAG6950139.1 hypothetical protein JG687_00014434 [Phytophthora cactorum]RAW40574.1 hypothetical protein PC110_g3253 [Phytophthora cactorum]